MMRVRSMRGSSLLEAAIACALLALAALGVIAALFATIRGERDAATREQALLAADSWAEMARAGGSAGVDWNASVYGLRRGKLVVTGTDAGISTVRVEWEQAGAAVASASRCEGATVAVRDGDKQCVTLAYAITDGR
ncbi:hypothetical protein QZM22_03310 [Burkholderia oklahomensis]|uniref:hypothetical protein n=1 Tax=Burkholderia oklahomensis TaxID=342113 RepID=UPI002653D385|nr:hypothetical protein [Burkholderia oklahomensis]MDN7671573.1 hypothetical protein [Burkholderia oklahomensis]